MNLKRKRIDAAVTSAAGCAALLAGYLLSAGKTSHYLGGLIVMLAAVALYFFDVFMNGRDWLDLQCVFTGSWLFTIGMAALRLCRYQKIWEGKTWALFAGALSGAGLALVYWRGSSTGGTDFLIMSLRKKFPHLSIGTISICIDGMVILLGGVVFGRIDAVLQGIVMTAVSTTVIDKITAGFMTGQVTFIVTGKPKEISDEIMHNIGRGVTSIRGTGMFSGSDRTILMCACSRAEACHIRGIAYSVDKSALVLLCPYDTAYGLGFQQLSD